MKKTKTINEKQSKKQKFLLIFEKNSKNYTCNAMYNFF